MSSSLTVDAVDALVEGTATVHVCALFQPLWPSTHGPSTTFALRPGSSAVNAGWGWLARRATWDIVRPAGDLLRRRRGLRRRGHLGYAAALRRTPTLLATSSVVVPPTPDWPPALRQTGFWFRSDPGETEVEERLRAFVAAGSPPVYVGFGSMPTGDPDRLLGDVMTAFDERGVRGVIGSGLAGLGRTPPAGLPDSVLVVEGAPHEWLFPRCAAVVHHGGAGTTAAALRAGVPQVVVPHIADQPYWGRRVHDLGVGPAPVARKDLTAARLAAALGVALADETRSAAYLLGALISSRGRRRRRGPAARRARSDAGCQLGALTDGPLRVELRRDVGASDDVDRDPPGGECRTEVVDRLLPGAEHDGVHVEHLRVRPVLPVGDVQACVVDALVVDAGVVMDTLGLQGRPMDPAGRLRRAPCRWRCSCAGAGAPRGRRARWRGSVRPPAGGVGLADTPLRHPLLDGET